MRDMIRLDKMRTAGDKHLSDHRFAAGNAAREPNLQQSNPSSTEMFLKDYLTTDTQRHRGVDKDGSRRQVEIVTSKGVLRKISSVKKTQKHGAAFLCASVPLW